MPSLSAARYGKDNIRVYKVHKDEKTGVQEVTELTVCVLLEGEIEISYTKADNSVVVPTDTMKQTTYIVAKQNPVHPPELFAAILAAHFPATYKHIKAATVSVIQHRWTRMTVDGAPHPHSFYRDGDETRHAEARATADGKIALSSALKGLLVLKSTGSAFHGYINDEYTILQPTDDRILSTDVDAGWTWTALPSLDAVKEAASKGTYDKAFDLARKITMETFAKDSSASVQNTMYKMCEQILAAEPAVAAVEYSLPNKHYFEIDLSWHKGLKNLGKDAEVYAPQSNPNGLIKCTVSR